EKALQMKTAIAAVVFAGVAIAGMFVYLKKQSPISDDSVPTVTELPNEPKSSPDDEPAQPSGSNAATNKSKVAAAKIPERKAAPAHPDNSKPAASKEMFYTLVPDNRGGPVPSRVVIHNTPMGKLTILLIGSSGSDGRLFSRSGTSSSGGKKYTWQVT